MGEYCRIGGESKSAEPVVSHNRFETNINNEGQYYSGGRCSRPAEPVVTQNHFETTTTNDNNSSVQHNSLRLDDGMNKSSFDVGLGRSQ